MRTEGICIVTKQSLGEFHERRTHAFSRAVGQKDGRRGTGGPVGQQLGSLWTGQCRLFVRLHS